MPVDFHRVNYRLPKLSHGTYGMLMHTLHTALGFGASEKAQFRLHCVTLLEKYGWQKMHDAFPHISRATVFRWQQVLHQSGGLLNALVPKSTRPLRTRSMMVSPLLLGFLKAMREQHPHLSKYKLKPFLDSWCHTSGIPTQSVSWIGKVITRNHLFFGNRKRVYHWHKHARSGYTIRRTPNPETTPFGYLQVDGVKVYWGGEKVLFFTALELKTRTAWVNIVPTLSSLHAVNFLKEIMEQLSYRLHTIHTDNGSEFKSMFDQALITLKLTHLWSPPKSPKIHSHIERFNGVFQEEFVDYNIDTAVVDPDQFTKDLHIWLTWYNTQRPHHSLHLSTPRQYLLHLQKGESLKCP